MRASDSDGSVFFSSSAIEPRRLNKAPRRFHMAKSKRVQSVPVASAAVPAKVAMRKKLVMRCVPREDEVVFRLIGDQVTGGGIILPEKPANEPMVAEVVAVSDGYRASDGTLIPIDLKKGDRVLVRANRGARFRVPGQAGKVELWHCSCHDIVLRFEDYTVDVPVGASEA